MGVGSGKGQKMSGVWFGARKLTRAGKCFEGWLIGASNN